ncbi:BTAD domain-containing putative transcriptional regulator [Nonomuraea typhae]|uniref:BTAD domain-containing putative transcriptional regulator n=1 Tax=Nonomuraea typhae TaxID=2603600 RepID=A0ABW7ZBE2_9ACTN
MRRIAHAEIRLLGPVQVHGPGGPLDVGPARQRCVLAVLAENPGALVSVDMLIFRVWGDTPPARARQGLHTYIARLRRTLRDLGDVRVVNRDGGYVLEIAPERVDVVGFHVLAEEARGAVKDDDDPAAAGLFADALDLWRGGALAGIEGEWAEGVRARLAEQRLIVLQERIEVDLRLGRHSRLVPELTDLVREHPARERLIGQLMLALYRCRRQSHALSAYRELKRRLDEEGLYPDPTLQELERRILQSDETLDLERPGPRSEQRAAIGPGDPVRDELIAEMRRRWIRQGLERGPADRIEVSLAEQPDAVSDSFSPLPPGPLATPQPLPASACPLELFRARFNRRLLILGAAGSGKTTLLLELARDLLDVAEADAGAAVPVMFLLSRWSERSGDFGAWIVAELKEHYALGAEQARTWLAEDRLILLLDGLDEVPEPKRQACIQAVNDFRASREGALCGLVVTARIADYRTLGTRLALGGALVLLPLTARQVDDYLARTAAGLRAALNRDPVLAELLTTPLALGLAVFTYEDHHPIASGGGIEQYRSSLNDGYLARMLARDRAPGPGRPAAPDRADPAHTHRSLVWLARLMTRHEETIFYPDWFTPTWLPGSAPPWPLPARAGLGLVAGRGGWRRLAAALTYGTAAALITGVVYGLQALLGATVPEPDPNLATSLAFAPLVAITVCLAVVITTMLAKPRPAVRALVYVVVLFGAGGLHKGMRVGAVEGIASGLATGLAGGVVYGATSAASVALVLLLAAKLVRAAGTRWTWSWPRMLWGLDIAMAIALAVGVSHAAARIVLGDRGWVFGLLTGFGYGLIVGLGGGLIVGIAFGLVDIDTDQPAARWRWSARRLALAFAAGLAYGTIHWLLFVVAVSTFMGPDKGPIFGLIVGLTFFLTFTLGFGMSPDRDLPPPAPARALTASLRAAAGPMIVSSALSLLAAFLARRSVVDYVQFILPGPAVLSGLLTFWFTGGGTWLSHHVTRWTAWHAGLLPRNLIGFLAHADERALLHRQGGGYQFPHGTLQAHIARRDPGRLPA